MNASRSDRRDAIGHRPRGSPRSSHSSWSQMWSPSPNLQSPVVRFSLVHATTLSMGRLTERQPCWPSYTAPTRACPPTPQTTKERVARGEGSPQHVGRHTPTKKPKTKQHKNTKKKKTPQTRCLLG